MDEMSTRNRIVLGASSTKLTITKLLDSLCASDGNYSLKEISERSGIKSKYSDSLDFLKTNFKIKIDGVQSYVADNLKVVKKRKKAFLLKNKPKSSTIPAVSYLSTFLSDVKKTTKNNDSSIWFSKKIIATDYIRQCGEINVSAIYSNGVFFRSRSICSFDYSAITFQMYLKEWYGIEINSHWIKSIVIYSKRPIIKVTLLKAKVSEELSKLSIKHGIHEPDIFKHFPYKSSDVKDSVFILSNNFLSKLEFERLSVLYGNDKVQWNESDIESKDTLENILGTYPHLSELIVNNVCPNWNLIFKPRPADPNIIAKNIAPLNSTQNIHSQSPVIRMQQQPQPQPQSNVFNLIVNCPTTSTPNKYDPLPNIFHRMRNDTPQIIPNGSYQLSAMNSNISVAAFNQFIANGTRPNPQQQVLTLPMILNVDRPAAPAITATPPTILNNIPKPAQTDTLTYIPNRNLNNVFETFHYNPTPGSDVLIHGSDLLCLNFGQYLNDNIINFYLNYIRYEIMTEDQRQRTHLFNVFFNTKLQGTVANMITDTPDNRHARVAKWTKKVDIFDKDFIIIPINENQHWFLAIVCFPWMAGMISYDQLLGTNNNQQISEIPVNKTLFATKYRYERVKRLQDHYGVEPSPCILLFDSLQYQSRAPNVKLIRDYLKSEWDSKRGLVDGPLVFDKNTVRGFNPQVPQQDNNIDCGIFVLHYVEQFFSNPLKVFTKDYFQSSLTQWFDTETVTQKRAAIQKMVLAKADNVVKAKEAVCHNTSGSDLSMETGSILVAAAGLDDSGPDIQML